MLAISINTLPVLFLQSKAYFEVCSFIVQMSHSTKLVSYEYEDHVDFPANAEACRPHILRECREHNSESSKTPKIDYELCDYIATMLHRLSTQGKYPNALDQFFDPKVPCFRFWRTSESGEKWTIRRDYQEVIVSTIH